MIIRTTTQNIPFGESKSEINKVAELWQKLWEKDTKCRVYYTTQKTVGTKSGCMYLLPCHTV